MGEQAHEVRHLLRTPAPTALGRGQRAPAASEQSLDQIELADRLGYDYAWEVEHHFLEEYSHSSAPEVFLAAASQRTKNIRLGHGIIQLTTNHPARVAERVATLDLVSATAASSSASARARSVTELHPFDRRFRDKRDGVGGRGARAASRCSANDGWEYHGEYFEFPLRNVLPKPLQKPHPPLWVACSQLDTIAMAGRRGMGALGFQFVTAEAAHAWVNAYYNAYTKRLEKLCRLPDQPEHRGRVAASCAPPTDEEALREGRRLDVLPVRAALLQHARRRSSPGTVNLWDEYQEWKRTPQAQKHARAAG